MRYKRTKTIYLALALGFTGASVAAAEVKCTDIKWSDIPPEIRGEISKTTGGDVSPQGGPFNPTDVISDSTPRARFFGACHIEGQWTIAIERGGRGHFLQVFKFLGGVRSDEWTNSMPSGGFTSKSLEPRNER